MHGGTGSESGRADAQPGEVTALTCPDCGGAIWEETSGGLGRFHCRIGHAYSDERMLEAQAEALEDALWSAVVALQERADLLRRVQARLGGARTAPGEDADEAERQAAVIRAVIGATLRNVGVGSPSTE